VATTTTSGSIPKKPDHFGLTNDLGVRLTNDHGKTFQAVVLPIAQMYHVATDNQVPYWIYGNRQDNGTMRGPSTAPEATTATRGIAAGAGRGGRGGGRGGADTTAGGRGGRGGRGVPVRGDTSGARVAARGGTDAGARGNLARGDTTSADSTGWRARRRWLRWNVAMGSRPRRLRVRFTLPDLTTRTSSGPACYGNEVTRYDHRTKRARSVSPWIHSLDSPPNKLKYRCHWTPPLAIDPFDHNTVYYGCQVVFKTSNQGQSWSVISPDLSTQDPSRIVSSGGIVEDNLGQFLW
jgi:hypothetical protein